jgi:hypothetical protein
MNLPPMAPPPPRPPQTGEGAAAVSASAAVSHGRGARCPARFAWPQRRRATFVASLGEYRCWAAAGTQ